MSATTAAERIARIVAELAGDRTHLSARARDENSQSCLEDRAALVSALEAEFGIRIPDYEARNIFTAEDALRALRIRALA